MSHTDPTRRHDFVLLFDVMNGNPNGDPDAGNMPRVDPETDHGIVTDVAIKRKVRDYVARHHDLPIFIQSQDALNTLILRSFKEVGAEPAQVQLDDEEVIAWFAENQPEGFDLQDDLLVYVGESSREPEIRRALMAALGEAEENRELRGKLMAVAKQLASAGTKAKKAIPPSKRTEARNLLCRTYYDIRMFGAVLSTGLNAGQVRGPAQITFARSVDPIPRWDLTITRQARTTTERMGSGGTEMGRKPIVPYALYRAHGAFSPYDAKVTGVTKADLELLWEALSRMFDLDRSAARGEMATRGLYVFTHESPLGNAPAHRLFQRIRVARREGVEYPRAFEDYQVQVDAADLPNGVSLAVLLA